MMRIRRFRLEDEAAVRLICLENGRLPKPIRPADWLFMDYWTRYYTRHEPEHVWVAERDGEVAGYVMSAFSTQRFRAVMKRRVLPWMLLRSALRGTIALPASRLFLLKRIAMWSNSEADPEFFLERFPAHLHVNLRMDARNAGVGAELIETCLAEGRITDVSGFHLETGADNNKARKFFEKLGFREVGRRYPFRLIDPAMADRAVILYGKSPP